MNKALKRTVITAGLATLAIGGVIALWPSEESLFLTGGCGEEVISSTTSPNGRYVAVVFERNCGATTGWVTHVNLREVGRDFPTTAAGTVDAGCIYLADGKPPLKLTWESSSQLRIKAAPAETWVQESNWKGVAIRFK